jgi:hypothetical protein
MFDAYRLAPLISAIQRIKTSSILAPLLVLDIIMGVVALIGSAFVPSPILETIWMVFIFCILFTLGAYAYWSYISPNRLQTERFQLEHQRLLVIGDERDPNSVKLIESAPSANTKVGAI